MPVTRWGILGRVPTTIVSARANELAAGILHSNDALPAGSIQALCAMACSPDTEIAGAGTDAIFRHVIEHWADQFEPALCARYVEFFASVIEHYRRQPDSEAFDALLRELGLAGRQSLLERAEKQRLAPQGDVPNRTAVRKAFVLSRVTLGADVAVTSVFLAAAKQLFPAAEIQLVGGEKSGALFAGDERIATLRIEYGRAGTLGGRLNAWRETVQAISRAVAGLSAGHYVVLDPDSRITQLGLLPLVRHDDWYHFFESRAYGANTSLPLAQLSGQWLSESFGPGCDGLVPFVRLSREDMELGKLLRQTLKRPIASVNFGVGGNDAKRVGGRFELNLLRALLRRGYSVVLDHGAGAVEVERTRQLVGRCRDDGISIGEIQAGRCDDARLLTWHGTLHGFAGMIAASDVYAGYDSACGHIAAALGVRGIDIFSGAVCQRMRDRWSPWGKTPAEVVPVEPSSHPDEVLAQAERLIP